MQKLIVRHFGPIREAEIELDRLTILIGPNGSGKTLLAKLAFFFNLLPDWIYEQWARPARMSRVEEPQEMLRDTTVSDLLQKGIPALFRSYFGSREYLRPETEIEFRWDSGLGMRLVENDGLYLVRILQPNVLGVQLEKIWAEIGKFPSYDDVHLAVKAKIAPEHLFEIFHGSANRRLARYVPEIRAAYWQLIKKAQSDGIDAVWRGLEMNSYLDESNDELLVRYLIHRSRSVIQLHRSPEDRALTLKQDLTLGLRTESEVDMLLKLNQAFQDLTGGNLVVDQDGNETFVLTSGHKLKMEQASSGQRDIAGIWPMLYSSLWLRNTAFYAIEEPESHLYPLAQKGLVELLALFLNASGPETRMVITTHSPYVLSAANSLLLAFMVGHNSADANEVAAVIEPVCWLNPEMVGAYFIGGEISEIEGREQVRSILGESGLIGESDLDEASDVLGETFDELMAIRYKQLSKQP